MPRNAVVVLAAVALGGIVGLTSVPASALQGTAAPEIGRQVMQPIQYYSGRPYHDERWERRRYWREHRRMRDEARIAEAARREAWRIEQEQAARRAWRHAQRERYGYYRGY
jgi:hypothetical protein